MAKSVNSVVLDTGLNYVKNNANQIHVCSTEPTTRTEAVTTYQLASGAVTGTDFVVGAGAGTGRKTTVAAQAGLTIDNTGTALHVAVTSATELLLVTTVTSQALSSGGTVDVASFEHEIGSVA